MPTRPGAALPILNSALGEAEDQELPWRNLSQWRAIYDVAQDLLEAPTITELSLLRPQVLQLVQQEASVPALRSQVNDILRVLTVLRDSERVDMASDRLVYLHEATIILRQIGEELHEQPPSLFRQLLEALLDRFHGLVKSESELLRGQAQLSVTLCTERLVPEDGRVLIALEIANQGRVETRSGRRSGATVTSST